jgi:plasmid maintenance system killer protein
MYTFKASETFWKRFNALDDSLKAVAREKWAIFRDDPFDPRLGTHRINRLTSLHKTTVYGVRIAENLRVVFKIVENNQVYTIDIGDHDVYK